MFYTKWQSLLPNVRCKNKVSNIFLFSTFLYNEENSLKIIKVLFDIANWLELTNNVVRDKIIILKKDLMIVKNCRHTIYWRQDKLRPMPRFHSIKCITNLFYLQIIVLFLFFNKFWGLASSIVGFEYYSGVFKRKHIN